MTENKNLGSNSGNIAIGGILTECNEFSINLMTQENFDRYEYFEDADILNLKNGVVGGMRKILNATSFIDTSLATMISQSLSCIFFDEFLIKSSVSSEKPTNSFGLCLLFLPKKPKISGFFSIFISFNFEVFLILFLLIEDGLKSETAAAQTAM